MRLSAADSTDCRRPTTRPFQRRAKPTRRHPGAIYPPRPAVSTGAAQATTLLRRIVELRRAGRKAEADAELTRSSRLPERQGSCRCTEVSAFAKGQFVLAGSKIDDFWSTSALLATRSRGSYFRFGGESHSKRSDWGVGSAILAQPVAIGVVKHVSVWPGMISSVSLARTTTCRPRGCHLDRVAICAKRLFEKRIGDDAVGERTTYGFERE